MRIAPLRRSLLLIAVTALALAFAGPSQAQSPSPHGFGLNIQSLINWDTIWASPQGPPPPWDPYLRAMSEDGMGVARTDAAWDLVQHDSAASPYDWTIPDRIATALAKRGLRWLPVIDLAPAWAQQEKFTPPGCDPVISRYVPPKNPDQYAAFAQALANRYGRGGEFWTTYPGTAYPITQYEIWNEPNVDAYWNNRPSAAQYVAMYNAARTAILKEDKDAQVVVGGIVWGGKVDCKYPITNDAQFIRDLFAAGGAGWKVDGIAVHPYGPATLNIVANLRREQQALQAVGRTDVPLLQTELGWAKRAPGAPAGTEAATYISDAGRAGTTALVTDTVMGSDCNVTDYLGYAAVEREASLVGDDPVGVSPYNLIEHWMGYYGAQAVEGSVAPGSAASAAFAGAIQRDRAGGNATKNIPVCAAVGAPGRLLPLSLATTPDPSRPGCWAAAVTYQGLPVDGAELLATEAIGLTAGDNSPSGPTFTNGDGLANVCARTNRPFELRAEVGGGSWDPGFVPLVARSTAVSLTCPAGTSCGPPVPEQERVVDPPSPTPAPTPAPAPACALGQLSLSGQRLATIVRRKEIRAVVRFATLGPANGCALTLRLTVPAPKSAKRPAGRKAPATLLLGTATVTLSTTTATVVPIRLSVEGRRHLKAQRRVKATVDAAIPAAQPGTQAFIKQVTFKR